MPIHASIRTVFLSAAVAGTSLFGAVADDDHKRPEDHGDRPDPAEMSARLKEKQPELFKKLDTNKDGTLSKDELDAGREQLRKLREEGGDRPDPAEMSARLKEKHPEIFKQLDTNNDGALNKEELDAGRETLRKLKGERDGEKHKKDGEKHGGNDKGGGDKGGGDKGDKPAKHKD